MISESNGKIGAAMGAEADADVMNGGNAGAGNGSGEVVQTSRGVTALIVSAVVYGMFPLYWAALSAVSAMDVMLYRIVTAAIVMVAFMLVTRRWKAFVVHVKAMWATPRVFWMSVAAAVLVTIDWVAYIYLVSVGRTSEASAGGFLLPLISMFFALVFLRERTSRLGAASMALALAGCVLYVIDTRAFPTIAFVMVASYSGYCLIKRFVPLDAFESLTFETGVLAPFAAVALLAQPGLGVPSDAPAYTWPLLAGCGVLTAVPLVLTSYAVKRATFLMVSFTQFITPTIQLFLGMWVLGERVPASRFLSFGVIWLALFVYSLDLVRQYRAIPRKSKD